MSARTSWRARVRTGGAKGCGPGCFRGHASAPGLLAPVLRWTVLAGLGPYNKDWRWSPGLAAPVLRWTVLVSLGPQKGGFSSARTNSWSWAWAWAWPGTCPCPWCPAVPCPPIQKTSLH